ncbi:iron ABC transporter permease [Pseudoflavitalea sp. G-6-1-2]|uniref:FecCD family ABC transporter permease n=1 Tax=Pseudoflavitalea sp. G-6-1-2 TaxID=2728841 RepID=UPI00146EC1DE|nr:iron ABC transporter permease [Pseudoflavitalea sp. G-6-1-2]NML20408.1 iron ABC transporter permease [Pseudoflavitalea sp. G-6-1-2]
MRNKWITITLIVLLIAVVILSAGIGAMKIPPAQVMAVLLNKLGIHLPVIYDEGVENVLLHIRLPRVVMAVLVGAGLAISGVAMQGLFRNPLADPALIGISSGASLSAVLVIVLISSLPALHIDNYLPRYYLLNVITFLGACATSLLVFRISRSGGKTMLVTLLLAGVALNALCRALTDLITTTANDEQLRNATFWSMGSLGGASWNVVLTLLPFVLAPILMLPGLAKSLNAFALGENEAAYLGINVKRLKTKIIILATLAVGASVAVAGIIGFVGLIVPHMVRSVSGNDHRSLLLNSTLLGASLLTLADVFSRTIIAPAELPIGIVTAVLGTPVFVMLLIKQKKQLRTVS